MHEECLICGTKLQYIQHDTLMECALCHKKENSKTLDNIPSPDVAVSMGCDVGCPFIGRDFDENWGLPDPTGQSDKVFIEVIQQIEQNIRNL